MTPLRLQIQRSSSAVTVNVIRKVPNCLHVISRETSLRSFAFVVSRKHPISARACTVFHYRDDRPQADANIDTRQYNLFLLRKSTVAFAFRLCLRLLQPERRDRYLRRISNLRRPVEFFQTSCSCKNIGVGRWQVGPKELCEPERLRARSTVLPQGHAKSLGQRPA
jgi:hypothetical protein